MAEANAQRRASKPRPTSPHLQVYSPQINMVMSILHRLTGAALYAGSLLLAGWLIAAAMGPDPHAVVSRLITSVPGQVVMIGYTWTLMLHAIGGIRYLVWDTGRGFALSSVNFMSWATLILSILVTAGIWSYALLGNELFRRIGL